MTTPDLLIVEDRTMERADARWLRLRCACGCHSIEMRVEPAECADAILDALRLNLAHQA